MALEGSLSDMSLVDLFQIFQMGPKTGVLVLSTASERGIIYVAEGRLLDAILFRGSERSVVASADEAVIRLLQWQEANFVFRHNSSINGRPARIVHDTQWLILEGVRRREKPLHNTLHHTITMETRLALVAMPCSSGSGINLDMAQWRILSQIAITSNVGQICKNLGIDLKAAIRTISELAAAGLVDILPLKAAPIRAQRPALRSAPALQPALAVGGGFNYTPSSGSGRSLLQAIMRRVNGL